MLFLLRKVRKKLMNENKFSTYLIYAIGEIILVVVGILIAVKIDSIYTTENEEQQQIQYYQGIVTDLRRDSVQFQVLINSFKQHNEYYYEVYDEINGSLKASSTAYEWMLYNRTFAPVTQKNHQVTIDKINSFGIRGSLNDYFARQELTMTAVDEFNKIIVEESRPYFIYNNAFNYDSVFHPKIYGFLPKGPLLNPNEVKRLKQEDRLVQILALLRISSGHVLSEFKALKQQNAELIMNLNEASLIDKN